MRDGLDDLAFSRLFHALPVQVLPELTEFAEQGLADHDGKRWGLTPLGMELSDWIGPALYAPRHRAALEAFVRL